MDARAQTEESCRATCHKRRRELVEKLMQQSTLNRIEIRNWMDLLGYKDRTSPEAPEITWHNFVILLKRTQRENTLPGAERQVALGARKRRAVTPGRGTWFTDIILASDDLIEHVCSYFEMNTSQALRMACRLPEVVLKKLRSKCTRLNVVGTVSNFPHGRLKNHVAYVGIEKEVGVAVAITDPMPSNAMPIDRSKWCVNATKASNFTIAGVRDRTSESRGGDMRKIEVENGEAWHTVPAGKYFKKLPTVRLELCCADTQKVLPKGMMIATRSSSIGLISEDGAAMVFTLGARYRPATLVGSPRQSAEYLFPKLDVNGPSVATVYAGFKLSHRIIEPPYRKKRFYLRAVMYGQQEKKDGVFVDVETEARGEVFEVRRRAAPAMSDHKKRELAQ